jgi:hypothetical protein
MLVRIAEQRGQPAFVAGPDTVGGPQRAQAQHAVVLLQDLIAQHRADGTEIGSGGSVRLLQQLARLAGEVDVGAALQLDQLEVAEARSGRLPAWAGLHPRR